MSEYEQPEYTAPRVYAAILDVMAKLAKEGISKSRKNETQGYKFRGIDEVYNALSPFLAEAGLVILPRFSDRQVVERVSAKDKALFYVTLQGEFDLVSPADGSKHTVGPFYGEAMDSGDKATNKAMSAAFKYMAMEVFCIPTEGDNDADSTTHEVKVRGNGIADGIRPYTATDVAKDALASMEPDEQNFLREQAMTILARHDKGLDLVGYIADQKFETEEKLALWSLLPSNVRSAIKKATPAQPATQI